jgi:hypothetical protein
MRRYKKMLVIWEDATLQAQHTNVREARHFSPDRIRTVGFLLKADKRKVSLAFSVGATRGEDCSDILTIPVGCILDIREVREVKRHV